MAATKRSMKNYRLQITAGPSRDIKTHHPIPVNSEQPFHLITEHLSTSIYVRIRNYRGSHHAPTTSPYFDHKLHINDQYSISFSPLQFKSDVPGDDLVLGNDFDLPINKNLPPGFSVAWRVARWVVDPGLEGDPWAEKPWLEGRVLSSVNVLGTGDTNHVGEGKEEKGTVLEESFGKAVGRLGKDGEAEEIPKESAGRMKFFLTKKRREEVVFKKDEKYFFDFYNPYIDFNEFSLKLPGVQIKILKYWDGQPLRYILKNRVTQDVYAVVQFTLVEKADGEVSSDEDDDEDEEDVIDEHAGKEEERRHSIAAEEEKRPDLSKSKEGNSKGESAVNDDDVD